MEKGDIKKVIKGEVQHAWELLCFYDTTFGSEHELTLMQRTKWSTLDDLWKELFPNDEY
mgnify:CR=1 FL=1